MAHHKEAGAPLYIHYCSGSGCIGHIILTILTNALMS